MPGVTCKMCIMVCVMLQLFTFCIVGIMGSKAGNGIQDLSEFLRFFHKYNKRYKEGSKEFWHRFHVFQESLQRHQLLNRGQNISNIVYGVTKFSDLTPNEYKELYLSKIDSHSREGKKESNGYTQQKIFKFQNDIPKKVDWREKGIVSPVKNQLSCGACWLALVPVRQITVLYNHILQKLNFLNTNKDQYWKAFSTVETVESMHSLKTKEPVFQLSVQEVIDCAAGNFGCDGGDTCGALQWMVKIYRVHTETVPTMTIPLVHSGRETGIPLVVNSLYPLTDQSQFCQILTNGTVGVVVKNSTCDKTIFQNEMEMLNLLANVGPVTVSVDASTWNDYMGGIIQYHCRGPQNNHAVQIVGYDLTGPVPFYIVRNSWGTDFGHEGYLYIKYGANVCGIAREVSTVEV